jgi:hypothetical protein
MTVRPPSSDERRPPGRPGLGARRDRIVACWRGRYRDEYGMSLTELLLASTLLVNVLTLVAITMNMVTNVQASVSSQFQEYDQALPALAPSQSLIRSEVEPAATAPTNNNNHGGPQPGFAQYTVGVTSYSLNFALQFYSNIGTASNNCVACNSSTPTTAGPAKIVALEVDQSGNPVTSSTTCTPSMPCKFQVRRYLPLVNSGTSTCPVNPGGSAGPCQYPATYTLLTNVLHVTNNPNPSKGALQPIFSYSIFDPDSGTAGIGLPLTTTEVQNNLITGLSGAPYNYPTATQAVTACAATNPATYPTIAIACPLDAVQSVGIDLRVSSPGSGTNGTVENQTIVYRYQSTGPASNATYPYKFTSPVG